MAQTQAVISYTDKYPDLFDRRVVIGRALKQMKIPNLEEMMPQYTKPQEMHAADENAAMSMGRMAVAYPRQDHMAHIATHLAFAKDPSLGMNPLVAPMFIPSSLAHIKQHMMLWYTQKMNNYTLVPAKIKHQKYEDSKLAPEIDRAMAAAAEHLTMDTQQTFAQIMPQIQQMMQAAQQFTQAKPAPMDGDAQAILQASTQETQRRAARDQADIQLKQTEMQNKNTQEAQKEQFAAAMNTENNLTKERIETLGLTIDAARLKKEQGESAIALQDEVQRSLRGDFNGNR